MPDADLTAPPIASPPGSFPHSVLHERHPALLAKVRGGLPYPPEVLAALDALGAEITGVIAPLPPDAHDLAVWESLFLGMPWDEVPFLWAESYFYRKLLEAVGYFRPGPWWGVDPFEPFKSAELTAPALATELAALPAPSDAAVLTASLWGNRADLGFQLSVRRGAPDGPAADALIADGSEELWALLGSGEPGTVCVVADNAARELVPDLVLADHLLATGRATAVVLHVKPWPYYVSDAMTADVVAALRLLRAVPGRASTVGDRLWRGLSAGTLVVRAHPFSCAPWSYDRAPADLLADFASATLTIMKGDLNYRRLVGDRHWPGTTPFASVTSYFPGRVAALRTVKSDVVVGVPQPTLDRLDATGEPWRVTGHHAMIQIN